MIALKMSYVLLLPILYILCIVEPINKRKIDAKLYMKIIKSIYENTSMPIPASKSKKKSTKDRTSLAAFALLIKLRNGLVALINSASSFALPSFL